MLSNITTKRPLMVLGAIIGSIILGIYLRGSLQTFYLKIFSHAAPSNLKIAALYDQGALEYSQGKIPLAVETFKQAIKVQPEATQILLSLGKAAVMQEEFETAIHYFETVVAIEPRYIQGYITLASLYLKTQNYKGAITKLETVLELDPHNYEALIQLSAAYMETQEYNKALEVAKKAVQAQPKLSRAYIQLGHLFNKIGNIETSKKMYELAVDIDKDLALGYYNLGYSLMLLKEIPQAIEAFNKAVLLKPSYVEAHMGLAECYWTLNNFEQVSKEFAIRRTLVGTQEAVGNITLWNGQNLQGKTILLSTDHGGGIGDTLQFIRFARIFKEHGATVICKTQSALAPLLSSYKYFDSIITHYDDKTSFDYVVPLLNAPDFIVLNHNKIPAEIPYLQAKPALVKQWAQKIKSSSSYKIGLCWHVDPRHETIKSPWSLRSVPLEQFTPLSQIGSIDFYSLQKIYGEDQLKNVPETFKINTFGYHFDEKNGRFMDTAAVIMNLDLIITVDTSIAHLAGALGKEVWMLLPYSCDCRWGIEGSKTEWYPHMTLFRQPKPGDWHSAMNEIKKSLEHRLNKKGYNK